MPGAADTGIEQEDDQAQLRIRIDRQAVARYGLNVRDVQDVIELAIGGHSASTFFDGERRFDITVRYVPEARTDAAAIGGILVTREAGERVPLAQLADIQVVNGASIIARRENRRRSRSAPTSADAIRAASSPTRSAASPPAITLPAGYHVDWGGQFENLRARGGASRSSCR